MKKAHGFFTRLVAACCVAMLPVTLAACSGDASPSDAATAAFSTRRPTVTHDSLDKAQVPSVRDDSPHAKAVRAVESMSVEERVGQLFLARCNAESALTDIQAYHLGGFVLFGEDFEGQTPSSLRQTLSGYQAAASIPMLLAVDEEGGDVVRVSSARGNLLAKAIVTNRFQPMNANGKTVHMIGLPWHFGWLVPKRGGDSANLLTAAVGDPNSAIPESKAFMVNIEKMPDQDLPE